MATVLVDAGLDVDSHLLQRFINTTAQDAHAVSLEELYGSSSPHTYEAGDNLAWSSTLLGEL